MATVLPAEDDGGMRELTACMPAATDPLARAGAFAARAAPPPTGERGRAEGRRGRRTPSRC